MRIAYQQYDQLQQNVRELSALGFNQNSSVIQLLKKQANRVKKIAFKSKYNCFDLKVSHSSLYNREQLEDLITLHKKMMRSCLRDMHDYCKLGLSKKTSVFQFSHRSLIRLSASVENLDQLLCAKNMSDVDAYHCVQKVHRMIVINQHVLDQYKKALHDFRDQGIMFEHKKVAFIKEHIEQRVRIMHALYNFLWQ